MTAPLTLLPITISVPGKALSHPFIAEAEAVAKVLRQGKDVDNGGVVGTANTKRAEIYAWNNPVSPHIDNTDQDQYIYAVILKPGRLNQIGCICPATGSRYLLPMQRAQVFRLNDRLPHWTTGTGDTIALFTGCYDSPADADACEILQRGIARLASGAWTAPRLSPGFQRPLPNECWAFDGTNPARIMRIKTAERLGWLIEPCALCDAPAWNLDCHHPYHVDMNRCVDHHKAQEAA